MSDIQIFVICHIFHQFHSVFSNPSLDRLLPRPAAVGQSSFSEVNSLILLEHIPQFPKKKYEGVRGIDR